MSAFYVFKYAWGEWEQLSNSFPTLEQAEKYKSEYPESEDYDLRIMQSH